MQPLSCILCMVWRGGADTGLVQRLAADERDVGHLLPSMHNMLAVHSVVVLALCAEGCVRMHCMCWQHLVMACGICCCAAAHAQS